MKAVTLLSRIMKAALLLIFSMSLSYGQGNLFIGKRKASKKVVYKCKDIGKQKHSKRRFTVKTERKPVLLLASNEKHAMKLWMKDTLSSDTTSTINIKNEDLIAFEMEDEISKVEEVKEEISNMPLPNPVYFRFDTDELTHEDIHQIALAIEHVKLGKNIVLEGHTDSHGTQEYNMALSLRRANKIKKMMIEIGQVSGDAISVRYYGEDKPAVANDTHENRQLNRRVEFIVLN